MEAKIISCVISDGVIAYVHGQRYPINRLVIPEADDLVITPLRKDLYVWCGDGVPEGEVVAEIKIPSILADTAKEFLESKEQLQLMLAHPSILKYFAKQLPAVD